MSPSLCDSGDARRKHLIESHLSLVQAIARRYAGRGEPVEDLVQVGAIGLIKASDRFDPNRGTAFATFATPSIEGAIRHHLRDRVSLLRIPRELQRKSGELHHHSGELEASLGRAPTMRELATALGLDQRDVEHVLNVERSRRTVPISPDEDGVELTDESQALAGSDDRLLLAGSLRALDERERRIVLLRFHADMAERDIARELGISQSHVSRLLAAALTKLREDLSSANDQAVQGGINPEPVISPLADGERGGSEPRVHGRGGSSRRKRTRGETRIRHVAASEETSTLKQRESSSSASDSKAKAGSSHSGRFLVRMPSELHEQLARAAERKEVSLNRFVTDALAASLDSKPSGEEPVATARQGDELSAQADPQPPAAQTATSTSPPEQTPKITAPARTETIDPAEPAVPHRPGRAVRVAFATNLLVVVLAGLAAVVLLVIALQHGI